jgi:hypothetical protein
VQLVVPSSRKGGITLRHGKISTSWLVINLSTAIPTVLFILIYRESDRGRYLGPTIAQKFIGMSIFWEVVTRSDVFRRRPALT